jgi:hypothetical protein
MVSPVNGSTLASSSQTFSWNTGAGVTQYILWVGTAGAGSNNIAALDRGTNLTANVTGLPVNGSTIYVRLWSLTDAWEFRDYTYATFGANPAAITNPAGGSTLTSSSQTFDWNAGGGATQYVIWAGTTGAGSNNIAAIDRGANLNATITGLPVDGSTIHVRLWSLIGANWLFIDYTYTAVTANSPAAITSPTNGSTLASSSQTFSWDAGSGAVQYVIWVGTTGAGSQDIAALDRGMNQSATVTGLPTTGVTIYVRLWSLVVGGWQFRDYTYTAAGP